MKTTKTVFEQEDDDCAINVEFDKLQEHDPIKKVYVPLLLGKEMLSKINPIDIGKNVLVMFDLGQLVSVLRRRKYDLDPSEITGKVVFISYIKEHCDWVQKCDVEVVYVPYDELRLFFSGNEKYNFGGMKFDVIVGNPPFNPEKTTGRSEGNKIWHKFIERAFDLIDEHGHMLFVTPRVWRRGYTFRPCKHDRMMRLVHSRYVEWGSTELFVTSQKEFVDTDWWHLVMDKDPVDPVLATIGVLPNKDDEISRSILRKLFCHGKSTLKFSRNRGTSFYRGKAGPNTFKAIGNVTKARKGVYDWPIKKPPLYDDHKVIVDDGRNTYSTYYGPGIGHGEHTIAIHVTSYTQAQNLIDVIEGPVYRWFRLTVQDPRAFGNPYYALASLPKDVLDKPWQEAFGFTDQEIKMIEEC